LLSTISFASDEIMAIELCNRTFAVFDQLNAVVSLKHIDGTIIESRQLSYLEYQALQNQWPDYLKLLGMDIPSCNRFSEEFEISPSNCFISKDTKVKLYVETGRFYKTKKPIELNINDQSMTGSVLYSAAQSISLKNTTIEAGSQIMLHAGKTITLKQGCHVQKGAVMRLFVTEH